MHEFSANGVAIASVGVYLPMGVLSNEQLVARLGVDDKFLSEKIGIKTRRFATDDEPPSVMAARAVEALLEKSGLQSSAIDLLLLCTQNPDYRLPTTACLVQDRLGLRKDCVCFDVNQGCSGFIFSSGIAGNFVRLGRVKNAVIVMTDQYTRFLDPLDRNTVALFGDAAAAVLLQPCPSGQGIIDEMYGVDGSGARFLVLENSSAVRNPSRPGTIHMDGREIFKFAVKTIPEEVEKLLHRNGLTMKDIRAFVFHQANRYILGEIQKRMGISDEQLIIEMEDVGNTVSATIPIAFERLLKKNYLRPGDLVVFSGFGVGLSWGQILYKCGKEVLHERE